MLVVACYKIERDLIFTASTWCPDWTMDISTFSTRPSLASIWYLKWRPVSKQIQNVRAYPRAHIATIGASEESASVGPASGQSAVRVAARVPSARRGPGPDTRLLASCCSFQPRRSGGADVDIVTWGIWDGGMVFRFSVNFLLWLK